MVSEWWDQEVELLARRTRKQVNSQPVIFETGYGPSGLPHLGTFAEVARTSFVRWAFTKRFPDIPSRLIAFSDDMDGLRSVPENVPNKDMVRLHLGKPLSSVPDPFGIADSFSGHMIGRLKSFLADFGFEPEFYSSSECYYSGAFDAGLLKLLENVEAVKAVVLPTLQPETRVTWSPFLPICEVCGRYTTIVSDYHPQDAQISYACSTEFGGASGCGNTGRVSVRGGKVKVGWKVDWALRWMMLGVDYEMYGKDLIESAVISGKICKALGVEPPVGSFYELFLDEEGHKISKKIGNGISLDEWRSYAPDDSILYFLTKSPKKARKIGRELVGKTTDEFLLLLKQPTADNELLRTMMAATAPGICRKHNWNWSSEFDFSLLVSLVGALGIDDVAAVHSFLRDNPALTLAPQDDAFAFELVQFALRYDRGLRATRLPDAAAHELSIGEIHALETLLQRLGDADFTAADALQTMTYEVGKARDLGLREWFSLLYQALTKNPTGPRLGTLLMLLGRERSEKKLQEFLNSAVKSSEKDEIST